MKKKEFLTIAVGFCHDFAAGMWLSTLITIYLLERKITPGTKSLLQDIQVEFFYLGLFMIFVVFATGAGRVFTYVENFYGEDKEKARKKMLIIKHILLFLIFGFGTWLQYKLSFF